MQLLAQALVCRDTARNQHIARPEFPRQPRSLARQYIDNRLLELPGKVRDRVLLFANDMQGRRLQTAEAEIVGTVHPGARERDTAGAAFECGLRDVRSARERQAKQSAYLVECLTGRVVTEGERVAVVSDAGWRLPLPAHLARRALASSGQVIVGARHRNVLLSLEPKPDWIQGRVYTVEPTGDITYVHLMVGDYLVVASADPEFRADPDAPIWLTFEPEHMHLFDAETELLLRDGAEPAPMRLSPDAVRVGAV